jgi:heat shock protein HtpX
VSFVAAAILVWVAASAFALAFRTSLVLRLHGASLVRTDQAPLAHAVLADLSLATGIGRPRLFVISAEQPNGFALQDHPTAAVVITDGAFDRLAPDELRGLLALLVARLASRRSAIDATIAVLALVCCPFHPAHWLVFSGALQSPEAARHRRGAIVTALALPAVALARLGLPGESWFAADRAAVDLVGVDRVVKALQALDRYPTISSVLSVPATSSLFCRAPATSETSFDRVFATQPASNLRVARLRADEARRSQRR